MAEQTLGPVPVGIVEKLREVSTATVTYHLSKVGIRNTFMRGVRRLNPGPVMIGHAATLRLLPMREDLYDRSTVVNVTYPQRMLVETIESGAVMVVDARGDLSAGVLGDILLARMEYRGAAGVVTDGAMRDSPSMAGGTFPVYLGGMHGAASPMAHLSLDANLPIQCGGVTVLPGDIIFGDEEGVVVIPRKLAEQVVTDAWKEEGLEHYLLQKVRDGSSIRGVYPPSEETIREYEAWRAARGGSAS